MNKRVLLVDDEPDLNLTLKITLEENGFKVDSFTDPLSALENFKEQDGMYELFLILKCQKWMDLSYIDK